ncbi:hypothetical protein AVEN_117164-1 [Araneus ventricosus]|uniref:Uncharacterized protein n=1 Tax=Araneus ventricosus TaxID=182803 RepID=A0A4Y2AZE0_ARAVE|nr:hypothetical protein AVEN_117164-1 [Araneus ventricosus]
MLSAVRALTRNDEVMIHNKAVYSNSALHQKDQIRRLRVQIIPRSPLYRRNRTGDLWVSEPKILTTRQKEFPMSGSGYWLIYIRVRWRSTVRHTYHVSIKSSSGGLYPRPCAKSKQTLHYLRGKTMDLMHSLGSRV